MRRSKRCRQAAVLGAVVLVALGIPSAGAAGAGRPAPVFGVRPAYSGKTTLHGGHFDYALARGGQVSDGIALINLSLGVITLHLYPTSATVLPGGGISPGEPGAQGGVGSWIHVTRPTVTLLEHRSTIDAFTVAVPPATPSGDYLGAIVASYGAQTPAGNGLATQTRAALIVHLRVLGRTHLAVSVARPDAQRNSHGELLTVSVANHGNVLFTLTGAILIDGGRTARLELSPAGIYVLPGGHATLSALWPNPPFAGHSTARAVIDATVSTDPPHRYLSPALSLWFVPRWLAGLLGAVVISLAASNRWWRRRLAELREDRRVLAAHRAERRNARRRIDRSVTQQDR